MTKRYLVTGGAGFIGSALVRQLIAEADGLVLNVDALTYAGRLENLEDAVRSDRYSFVRADVADRAAMERCFREFRPHAIFHLAAESHVDRSIDNSESFIHSNILGVHVLLETALRYWNGLEGDEPGAFRFLHVSTDEVYGSADQVSAFSETSPYRPNSPYAASKASGDHLVRAWHQTYGLPTIVTNSCNNFGPYQFPEKLIPVIVLSALSGRDLPVYGDGRQLRDWLFVEDHARALRRVMDRGEPGQTYCISAGCEITNLDLVQRLCRILDRLCPESGHVPHSDLIRHVADRPGHDRRYALNGERVRRELGWTPRLHFQSALEETVRWYLENRTWCGLALAGDPVDRRRGLSAAGSGRVK